MWADARLCDEAMRSGDPVRITSALGRRLPGPLARPNTPSLIDAEPPPTWCGVGCVALGSDFWGWSCEFGDLELDLMAWGVFWRLRFEV